MKKIMFLLFLVALGLAFYLSGGGNLKRENTAETKPAKNTPDANSESKNAQTVEKNDSRPAIEIKNSAVFVPHWSSFTGLASADEDTLYYFGVVPTVDGIETEEPGYQNLESFISAAGNKEVFLTLRMVESQTNAEILSTAASWQKIADQTTAIVSQYGFDGVVLDLEVGLAGGLTTAPEDITAFTEFLFSSLEENDISMEMTIYGDNYYRKRPYDLKALDPHVDGFIIMAYDFHKSFGLAGPNFPLEGKEAYGYDFKTMIRDITAQVSPEKLTLTYGMFGYEWIVDEKNRPLKAATALSLNEVDVLIDECENCSVVSDSVSTERKVTFPAETGPGESKKNHVIWSETTQSVAQKQQYAAEQGITSSAFWAWGYY